MVVWFRSVIVVQQSSCRGLFGLLSRFLVSLRVKVLEKLFEAYRACFLKAFNFGQDAVNSCVETLDVGGHPCLAHAATFWKRTACKLIRSSSASARVNGTLMLARRPCRDSHTPSSYWSTLRRTSASVLNDVSIKFVMMVLSEVWVACFDVAFDH